PAALFLEQPRAGLEEPPAALVRLTAGLLLAGLQVGQVGQAERAADGAQVELDVILEVRVEGLEQGRAELLAGRAAQPGPPPDGADGVLAAVAPLHDQPELAAQGVGGAQGLLDGGQLAVSQGVVEVRPEVLAGDLGHGLSGSSVGSNGPGPLYTNGPATSASAVAAAFRG